MTQMLNTACDSCGTLTGRQEMFTAAMMMYAAANACIGATPAAYAADVMPQSVSGFGLGIYRCAGDIGDSPSASLCPSFSALGILHLLKSQGDTAASLGARAFQDIGHCKGLFLQANDVASMQDHLLRAFQIAVDRQVPHAFYAGLSYPFAAKQATETCILSQAQRSRYPGNLYKVCDHAL